MKVDLSHTALYSASEAYPTQNTSPKEMPPKQITNLQDIFNIPAIPKDHLKDKSPLKLVIIHGDPSKENSILPGGRWDEDDFDALSRAKVALEALGMEQYQFTWLCNHDTLWDDLRLLKKNNAVDVVLQLCDEGWENDSRMEMHVVSLCEMLHLPFTGASAKCIALTYDKQAVLKLAQSIGVPVPQSVCIDDDAQILNHNIPYPVFVKPNSTDGSFGITVKNLCHNEAQLLEAVKSIREEFQVVGSLLVQEFLDGTDVNVACMEGFNGETTDSYIFPISEEDYSCLPEGSPKVLGFESKWDESSVYYGITTKPTTLSQDAQIQIAHYSKKLFERIDAHDYARFDWRCDSNGVPKLLEANPNCGWSWDAHIIKTAQLCNISYTEWFERVITSCYYRFHKKAQKQSQNQKKFQIVGRATPSPLPTCQ